MRRAVRRVVIGTVAVVVVAAVAGARRRGAAGPPGPDLPDDTPLDHDGAVGAGAGAPLRMVWLGDSHRRGRRRLGRRPRDPAPGGQRRSTARSSSPPGRLRRPRRRRAWTTRSPDLADLAPGRRARERRRQRRRPPHLARRLPVGATTSCVAAVPDGALLVLLGVPDMGAPPRYLQPLRGIAGLRGRQLDEVDPVRRRGARRACYVDIAGETGPAIRADPDRYFAADGYHPSDDGYALWADAVLEQLAARARRRRSRWRSMTSPPGLRGGRRRLREGPPGLPRRGARRPGRRARRRARHRGVRPGRRHRQAHPPAGRAGRRASWRSSRWRACARSCRDAVPAAEARRGHRRGHPAARRVGRRGHRRAGLPLVRRRRRPWPRSPGC